jgi:hypothetical protein
VTVIDPPAGMKKFSAVATRFGGVPSARSGFAPPGTLSNGPGIVVVIEKSSSAPSMMSPGPGPSVAVARITTPVAPDGTAMVASVHPLGVLTSPIDTTVV